MRDVSRIDFGNEPIVTLLSGELLRGQLQDLNVVEVDSSNKHITRDLRNETHIAVRDCDAAARAFSYKMSAVLANATLAENNGVVRVDGLPQRRLGQPIVIACGSAWATNNSGTGTGKSEALNPSTRRYIDNIMDVLSGGAPANVLIYSDHWTFGEPFQQALRERGHQVTVTLSPGPLDQFDVVFVGGHEADQNALIDYVKRGGKVYLSGGGDANGGIWNDFLTRFGLYSQADSKSETAPGSGFTCPPLFASASSLSLNKLFHIVRTSADMADAQTICNQSETNAWGIYRGGEKLAPSPAQLLALNAKEATAAEKVRANSAAIAGRVVDEVIIGSEASERIHQLKGDKMLSGDFDGSHWRSADDGNSFSYVLRVDPKIPNNLICTFGSTDGSAAACGIYIDDKFIENIDLRLIRLQPGAMCPALIELRPELTTGKDHVVVRFQGEHGNETVQVFQCRMMRRIAGFNESTTHIVYIPIGKGPARTGRRKEWRRRQRARPQTAGR